MNIITSSKVKLDKLVKNNNTVQFGKELQFIKPRSGDLYLAIPFNTIYTN
jgi:hypothetical protein